MKLVAQKTRMSKVTHWLSEQGYLMSQVEIFSAENALYPCCRFIYTIKVCMFIPYELI